ncbi:MAG TPA: phosphoribosylamine--glycine ligase [bacterium]|nr:phosphoribosylamine--glycine ligase [bacterium]
MAVLVVGSGGREHALAWALVQEDRTTTPFCAPGNPGIASVATCIPCSPLDFETLAAEVSRRDIDLTIVGPEAPLAAGLVDAFAARGLRVFGPTRAAAAIESSKIFMKTLCRRYEIPTAEARTFDHIAPALEYVRRAGRPLVVKADGLAAGKGVVMARSADDAAAAVEEMMTGRRFGDAGARVVIEEWLEGREVSVFGLSDGAHVVPLLPARDYKRLLDGDRGPNTGSMGGFAPVPAADSTLLGRITDEILEPAVWAMAQEGRPYRGVLFAGLMLTAGGPRVLEFNARFGDPEAQLLMPLLASGLRDAAEAVLAGRVDRWVPRWHAASTVCVTLCASGYPERPRTGMPIDGVEAAAALPGVLVFHAGTAYSEHGVPASRAPSSDRARVDDANAAPDGRLAVSGGRVLNVVGTGPTLEDARDRAYRAAGVISFEGKTFRRDIGYDETVAHEFREVTQA